MYYFVDVVLCIILWWSVKLTICIRSTSICILSIRSNSLFWMKLSLWTTSFIKPWQFSHCHFDWNCHHDNILQCSQFSHCHFEKKKQPFINMINIQITSPMISQNTPIFYNNITINTKAMTIISLHKYVEYPDDKPPVISQNIYISYTNITIKTKAMTTNMKTKYTVLHLPRIFIIFPWFSSSSSVIIWFSNSRLLILLRSPGMISFDRA